MKKLILSTIIFITLQVNAQISISYDSLPIMFHNYSSGFLSPRITTTQMDSLKTFSIYDSLNLVAVQTKDSLTVYDSLNTIKSLISIAQYSFKQQEEQDKKYLAIQNILKYVTTTGYVLNKDRIKFNKAVSEYIKITKQKKKVKMQPLDILVRDTNGKALGWVSQ